MDSFVYQISITTQTTVEKADALRTFIKEFCDRENMPSMYSQTQHLQGLNFGPDKAPDGEVMPGDEGTLDAPIPTEGPVDENAEPTV
jgi:hypothetical protein